MKVFILTVSHSEFKTIDFKAIKATGNSVVFDTKGFLDRGMVDGRLWTRTRTKTMTKTKTFGSSSSLSSSSSRSSSSSNSSKIAIIGL